MKARWLLEAAGASLLLLLPYFAPLILPDHVVLFLHEYPLTNEIGGLLLDMLGLFFLCAASLFLLSKLPPIARRLVSACIAGLFIWRIADTALSLLSKWAGGQVNDFSDVPRLPPVYRMATNWETYSHPALLLTTLVLIALAWLKPEIAKSVVHATQYSLRSIAFCALWVIPQLLYIAFAFPGSPSFDRSSSQSQPSPEKRLVWILFDELSYRLIFDRPPEGQQFPHFDELRAESTSLGNIEPVGLFTDRVVPSLLANRRIDRFQSTFNGQFLNLDPKQSRWVSYDPNDTLFGDAKKNGWNPGVVGWYFPYCRIFSSILTTCSSISGIWTQFPFEGAGAPDDKSVFENALLLPRTLFASFYSHTRGLGAELRQQNIQDYRNLMTQAQNLIQNSHVGFVFLHLPLPHPPGVYDRKAHRLSDSGDYLDNLTLADDALGTLLREIGATPWADQTTVIVSSDHSWRVPMWRGSPDWTAEEERVSQGQFDQRPVFLVHFPGQKSGDELTAQMPELVEHRIVDSMLQGRMGSSQDLKEFLLASVHNRSEATASAQGNRSLQLPRNATHFAADRGSRNTAEP